MLLCLIALPAAGEPELFRSSGPLPDALLTGGGCFSFRGVGIEWATGLEGTSSDATAPDRPAAASNLLALGNVQALRFEGAPLRLVTEGFAADQPLVVERAGADRVLVDSRIEIDHGCVLALERYPLERVTEPAPRIAQIQLVEQMAQAIVAAQRAREDVDHAGSARQWARALAVREQLGLGRDIVSLQIDQQRIQSWAIASLPVPAEDAQRLVDEATQTLGTGHAVTANTYTALGWTLRRHGRHSEALAAFRRAHELTAETQGPTYRATLRLQQSLADQLLLAGRRSEALALMEAAYRHRVELLGGEHEETWRVLGQLTEIYAELGRSDEAEPLARQGYERHRASLGETHRMTLYSLSVLVNALLAAGRPADALPLLEREVAHRVQMDGSHPNTVNALAKLGETQLKLAQVAAARSTMQRAIDAENAKPRNTPPSAALMLLRGRVLASAGETNAARDEYARVLTRLEQRFGAANRYVLDARFESAWLARAAGDDAAARQLYESGITTLEALRAEGGMSVEGRQALLAAYADAYRHAAWVAYRQGRTADVLRLTELSKARTLLDTLTQRRAEASAGLAPEDQARVKDLAERINATQAQSFAARGDSIRHATLEVQKGDLVRELEAVQADLRRRSPAYAQLSAVRPIDRVERIRDIVPTEAVFVSYVVVPGDSARDGSGATLLALVMRRTQPLVVVDLGNADDLQERVARYRNALGVGSADPVPSRTGDRDKAAPIEQEIAARWLAPLRPYVRGHRRLVIAPDGPLATLPFEALPWDRGRLVDAFDVSYAQSLSVYAQVRERAARRRQAPRALFAIGAPQFESLARDTSRTQDIGQTGSTLRALRRLGGNWSPLPGAMAELRAVARLFPTARTEVVSGRDATEDTLDARNRSGDLRRYRYLLFATHGLLDPDEPALSALILGRDSPGSKHDGYVTALEWLDYRLQSELIVLSACSTGEGKLLKGEGVLGLPYAMFVAGNRDALLTLWPVADAGAREFVTRFFAQVRAGRSHEAALASVKRQFAREGRYRAAQYWAGFVLYGG